MFLELKSKENSESNMLKNRMEDAITFVAHKRTVNLPAMYMKSLSYDGKEYIKKLLPKYLGADDNAIKFLDYEACFSRYGKESF